jgi:hypothetical protein
VTLTSSIAFKLPAVFLVEFLDLVSNLHHQRPTKTYRVSAAALLAVW